MSLSVRVYSLLSGAWNYRYLIVIPMLLLPIIGGSLGATSSQKYRAHTSMLIQETAKMNPFLEDLAVSSMLKHRMAALKTLLHSRYILGKVALERGLLREDHTPWELEGAVAQLSGSLNIQMVGKDLIRIDFTSGQPEGMKETLESVSRHFVEQLLAPERSSISDSSDFLKQHIDQQREELDEAEYALAQFKNKNANLLPELHVTNISRLNHLRQALAEKEAMLAGMKKGLGDLNQQLSKTNPIIGRLEESIVELRGELTLLRSRYTDNHSKVQAVLRKLKRLEEERGVAISESDDVIDHEKLWDIASTKVMNASDGRQPLLISQLQSLQKAQHKSESLDAEVQVIRDMVKELEQTVSNFGQSEHELIRLQRDLDVKKELYADLLKRFEMARVTGSLSKFEESKRIKIIDLPYNPTRPINLPLVVFILGGLFGGLFLGCGLATIFALTDTKLRSCEKLEQITGVPVLVRIPGPNSNTLLMQENSL